MQVLPFTVAFHTQDNGAIALSGNSLLTCPDPAPGCANARAGSGSGAALNNNGYNMQYIDADTDASTYESSGSDVNLPADATVLHARLYWSARAQAGSGGGAGPRGSIDQMLLRPPGSPTYQTVTATTVDQISAAGSGQAYQAYADVTPAVRSAGAGTYFGANVAAGTGQDRYAARTLVVVYRSPSLPLRDLTIFHGFDIINSASPTDDIPISGFVTPPSGAVRVRLGVVAYEGDLGSDGDSFKLNGTPVTDAASPLTNLFNSTNEVLGQNVTSRSPAYQNQLGFDVKDTDASGIIGNGDTSQPRPTIRTRRTTRAR